MYQCIARNTRFTIIIFLISKKQTKKKRKKEKTYFDLQIMTPRSSRYSFELSFQLPDLIFQLALSFFPEAGNNFSLLKRRGEGRHISTGPLTYITTKTSQLIDLKKFKTPENRKETYLMTPADAKRTSVIIGLTSSIILVGPTIAHL